MGERTWSVLFLFVCFSGVARQCTMDQVDRIGKEVAFCMKKQQEMIKDVETLFGKDMYTQVIGYYPKSSKIT